MPRPIFLGNRRLHVNIDDHYAVRDLFWPSVGYPNHLSGHKIRLGLFADGRLSWLDELGWHRQLRFKAGARTSDSLLTSESLNVEVRAEETVLPDRDVWIRRITVRNTAAMRRTVRLFQTQDIHISESDIGDCAYYDPSLKGIVHYKDGIWLAFLGQAEGQGPDQFVCGVKAWGGMEGTWRDAEDGELADKPIEQGSVDSTMRFTLDLEAGASGQVTLFVIAGDRHEAVQNLAGPLGNFPPGELSSDEPEATLEEVSIAAVETHITPHGGLIACTDSDIMETARANYCYVWMRDTALTLESMLDRGREDLAQAGLSFAASCVQIVPGAFGQKYNVNGSLGAGWHPRVWEGEPCLPIQEDETALVPVLAGRLATRDLTMGQLDSLVRGPARFMASYLRQGTGLPAPSWDLWEERRGIHLWTTVCVIEGLTAAASILGHEGDVYVRSAEKMKKDVLKLFHSPAGHIARTLYPDRNSFTVDPVADASVLLALMRAPFADRLDLLADAVKMVEDKLLVRSAVGGVARYERDYYFRRYEEHPGNPWVICTLWYARALHRLGRTEEARGWLDWVERRKAPTGVLAEQYDPETGDPLSVSPLVWSHAEYLETLTAFSR